MTVVRSNSEIVTLTRRFHFISISMLLKKKYGRIISSRMYTNSSLGRRLIYVGLGLQGGQPIT